MTDSVSFKAYLKRDSQEVEVRRFGVDGGAVTSYLYLRSKIQAMFPSIQNDQFQVFWQDNDKDYIKVDSDEELLEALTTNQQPLKIYIKVENNSNYQGETTGSVPGASGTQQHPGVVCDGCESAVTGFRYKCVTCPDYDLCSRCENNSLHTEHFMLRMPTPMNNFMGPHRPKFLRKLFSHPHKFHKRHGWSRLAPPSRGCGDSQKGAGRCPFSRQGESPGAAFAGATGMSDMFDFSALMEFIESLGVAAGEEQSNQGTSAEATATTSNASQNTNQAPSSSQTQAQEPPQPQGQTNSAANYLNNIGQMVAAILDPLGVDVKLDVRPKTTQAQQEQASAASSPPTVPSPTIPQTTPVPTTPVPSPVPAPTTTQNNPITSPTPISKPDVPSTSSQTETIPAATIETQTEPARERRNSDDWTILNRESPIRNEMTAMDVDESQGSKAKTSPPPVAQDTPTPSAPPNTYDLTDVDRQRIEEAIDTFRSMGFDFNTQNLREMLRTQNGDILSVLEMMLNPIKK